MKIKLFRTLRILAVVALPLFGTAVLAQGCADDPSSQSENVTQLSDYKANLEKVNAQYNPSVPFTSEEDIFTALVTIGEQTIPAPTHVFGDIVNIIPYSNIDGAVDAAGQPFEHGDQVIAKTFTPGTVGIAIKHHRPEFRTLDFNTAAGADMKERFKLEDTHIEIVVGVEKAEHGAAGAITLNNPQTYENGRFGNETYGMVFTSVQYPAYAQERKAEYEANVLLALVGFNAVSEFPGDYNGGDPLGASTVDKVREHVDQMVKAIGGDAAALAWFQEPAHQIYCAELAYAALNAGIQQPINATTLVPRVGQEAWDAFVAQVELHNKGVDEFQETGSVSPGNISRFVELNDNKRVQMVRIKLADESLAPISAMSPNPADAEALAFQPMTPADLISEFLRKTIHREKLGEALAPAQAAVLQQMKPGLLEAMKLDTLPADSPQRVAVDQFYEVLVQTVGTSYENYAAFQEALAPVMAQARQLTGPRDDSGDGLFAPPNLYHSVAQGRFGWLLNLQYEGHGLHVSMVEHKDSADGDLPTPEPLPTDQISSQVSCGWAAEGAADGTNSCGGPAPGGCYCDATCVNYGDCCDDYQAVCGQ